MPVTDKPEVWLRGSLPGIIPALQPVAHALLQAGGEVTELMKDFPVDLLWQTPAAVASPGFHLQHMRGVLDRLFTYAGGQQLTAAQLQYLAAEGKPAALQVQDLVRQFNGQVNKSMDALGRIAAAELYEVRGVGRARVPSTVLGLLVHAAEHTMRHLGQLLVTVKVITDK